jgi:hypothetical protein
VVVLGRALLVTDHAERLQALRALTNHIVPGRWEEVREPNELEMRQTTVLMLPLEEVSAKIRVGLPNDDDEDYALPVWAGIVPISNQVGPPRDDGRLRPEAPSLDLSRFTRKR